VPEFIAYAKDNPGKINMDGRTGFGTGINLACVFLWVSLSGRLMADTETEESNVYHGACNRLPERGCAWDLRD
jgi:hypothetical protein